MATFQLSANAAISTLRVLLVASLSSLPAWAVDEANRVIDLEEIKTLTGTRYEAIEVLGADEYGLMFRHRRGIAKVNFGELSTGLRMLYEGGDLVGMAPAASTEPGQAAEDATSEVTIAEVFVPILTFRLQLHRGWKESFSSPCAGSPCASFPWRSHWPRYQTAHALTRPDCRALVLRDFLYTTGLQPKPCGVVTRSLPRGHAYAAPLFAY
jgi:hypothetical protein